MNHHEREIFPKHITLFKRSCIFTKTDKIVHVLIFWFLIMFWRNEPVGISKVVLKYRPIDLNLYFIEI